jgi:hypothetical protein
MFPETDSNVDSYIIGWQGISADTMSWKEGWHQIVSRIEEAGYPITHYEVKQGNHLSNVAKYTSSKVDALSSGWDTVQVLSIYAMPEGVESHWVSGYDVYIQLDLGKQRVVLSVADRNSPGSGKVICARVMESIIELLPYSYGIGCGLPLKRNPPLFMSGHYTGGGLPSREEPWQLELRERSKVWKKYIETHAMWEKGILRDVYSRNYLTRPLLEAECYGLPLQRWIEEGQDKRGILSQLSPKHWRWDVPINDIELVKSEMLDAGRIMSLAQAKALFPPRPMV